MNKLIQGLKQLDISSIFKIGLVILMCYGGWLIYSKNGLINGLNQNIDKLKIDLEKQDKLIAGDEELINELDKENQALSRELKKLYKRLNKVKKGSSMDDAIKLYRR